jgi:hypothetical protein
MMVIKTFRGGRLLEDSTEEGRKYLILEEARVDNLGERYYVEITTSHENGRIEKAAFNLIKELLGDQK